MNLSSKSLLEALLEGSLICGPLFLIRRDVSVQASFFFGGAIMIEDFARRYDNERGDNDDHNC
jgi:hypothetical protein